MRFSSVLVANRGEIAVRVLRAARQSGLRAIAVYSEADRLAPHVRAADAATCIGPAPATESYLSIPALIEAAARTGAAAVHPGYGFLSERSEFAAACRDAGLIFIGPSPEVMDQMGRKDAARRIAIDAGVPVTPAIEGDDETLIAHAQEIPFPLLVKAAAGGGGKGMRVVREPAALPDALQAARREAAASFGDDTLLVERFVEGGRHIEVQVLGDEHGNLVHLFERDCSTQRRHQKVLEEAPAPTISAALRESITGAAVRLATQVGYVNAGTVEFLVAGEEFFFLEMNTRLQVEHPVTELVTGRDLVQLQFGIAQGEPLSFTQDEVRLTGHAIEARVYAEDPAGGYLPQAGTTDLVRWSTLCRADQALESGQQVTSWYDPMLGKVIAHGDSREQATAGLAAALADTAILGVTNNLGFLRRLVESSEFAGAEIDTGWLDRVGGPTDAPAGAATLAAVTALWLGAPDPGSGTTSDPLAQRDGWRSGGPAIASRVELELAGDRTRGDVSRARGAVKIADRSHEVTELARSSSQVTLDIDGHRVNADFVVTRDRVDVGIAGDGWSFERRKGTAASGLGAATDDLVAAPMPGTVTSVLVATGDVVSSGQALGVLEAMKMELTLRAPHDGTVEVAVAAGDQVKLRQQLFVVRSDE